LTARESAKYAVTAVNRPASTAVDIAVAGPDPRDVARLANRIVADTRRRVATSFGAISVTLLDPARPPGRKIQPLLARNLLFAAAAGLIVAYLVAGVSLALHDRRRQTRSRSMR
jgi:capsular polysaccharide biosynthesis protein